MLYRYSEVFRSLMMAADLCIVAAAWLSAYWLRFHAGYPAPLGVPPVGDYASALVLIVPILWLGQRNLAALSPLRRWTAMGLRCAGILLLVLLLL